MGRIALIVLFCLLGATAARVQDEPRACEVLMCDNGAPAYGEPGFCKCGVPEPVESIVSGPPSCKRDFACADGNQVAFGQWPLCGCLDPEAPRPAPGVSLPDPAPGAGLGGGATCRAFFACQSGYALMEWGGNCVCHNVMLPME